MSVTTIAAEELHRLSVDDYHRLADAGGLEDARVELIDGLVVDMSPKSPEHENAIAALLRWLALSLDLDAFDMFITRPMTFVTSEPEPDVTVVERQAPGSGHPSSALLVIEVAQTSRDRDLRTKPPMYAPHVSEYWVVDLERRCVVVHRDAGGGAYRSVTVVDAGETLAPRSVPLATLDAACLFPA